VRRSHNQPNDRNVVVASSSAGLLGDTPSRDYSRKLQLFNAFAEPEIRRVLATLKLKPGMHVLDAGCGTGEALQWLRDAVKPTGTVVGVDLSAAHASAAQAHTSTQVSVLLGDVFSVPLAPSSFDFIWCMNTINHVHERVAGVSRLAALLRSGGRIALGQSSLVPDMYFAWDSRLERVINEAVRQYYREKYCIEERDLSAIRALAGIMRAAHLRNVAARTVMIERLSPLDSAAESYLLHAIFQNTWGERLKPYLAEDDYSELTLLCDPRYPGYALRRADFHFLQSFTVMIGEA
jgi:ubiquinone/menaquinone biosynthesis C-methylase UbiE